MIAISVLSLEPNDVRSLVDHRERDDTMCRPLERMTACGFALLASVAALMLGIFAG